MASWALLRNWTSLLQECELFCLLHPCLGGYLIRLSERSPPCPSLPENSGPLGPVPTNTCQGISLGQWTGREGTPIPLRLGNLRGGGAASGAFCRDTRVSPSPYLSMALLQSPRHERQERRDQERKERKGKGSAAQFVANKGYLSPFPPFLI